MALPDSAGPLLHLISGALLVPSLVSCCSLSDDKGWRMVGVKGALWDTLGGDSLGEPIRGGRA